MVPRAGLEPASLTASDFKSDAVTNFATEAKLITLLKNLLRYCCNV